MKKLISFAIALIMILVLCSGCTVTIAARKSKIVGTYKLTGLSDYNGSQIEEKGIEAYLVVTDTGSGYYVYKDADTPVTVRHAQITLHPDEEKPKKYSYVEYLIDGETKSYKCGSTGGGLNYSELGIKPNSRPIETYWKNTSWTREDAAQDLSYVTKQLGNLPEAIPNGSAIYDGYYDYSNYYTDLSNEEFSKEFSPEFVYAIFDVDVGRGKAMVYYMLKEDMLEREVEFDLQLNSDSIVIGEQTYELKNISSPSFEIPVEFTSSSSTVYNVRFEFSRNDRRYYSLSSNIDSKISRYEFENA